MAEQLLDRAQIRAALEQVGREGMAQGVRGDPARHRGLPDPLEQAAPDVGGREPSSAARDEQRALLGSGPERVTRRLG